MSGFARALAVATLATVLLSPPVQAQQIPTAVQAACDGDYRKLCANVTPGGGRIIACMRSRGSELTPACRGALRDEVARRGSK